MTKQQARRIVSALDRYLAAQASLHAAVDGPNDHRRVEHLAALEALVDAMASTPDLAEAFTPPPPNVFWCSDDYGKTWVECDGRCSHHSTRNYRP